MILTRLERETLLAIYKFVKEQNSRGIATPDPPSVRELMPMVKVLSTSSINYRIDKLFKMGLVAAQDHTNGRVTRLTYAGYNLAKELITGE